MARVCRGVFEQFQMARVAFVQEVATMATKPDLIEVMHEEGVIHQLHPLLSDHVRGCYCCFPRSSPAAVRTSRVVRCGAGRKRPAVVSTSPRAVGQLQRRPGRGDRRPGHPTASSVCTYQ